MSEFSRPFRADTIGTEPREVAIEAGADERAALAKRFDIVSLDALAATAMLVRQGREVRATGRVLARLVQACVATGVDLPAAIDVSFDVIFRDALPGDVPDAGLELDEGECDVVFYDGAAVDIGEAVAETLALEIEPYPRASGADTVLEEAGVLSEEQARIANGPFAGLAGLRQSPPA